MHSTRFGGFIPSRQAFPRFVGGFSTGSRGTALCLAVSASNLIRPVWARHDEKRYRFRRGKTKPKGVVWFGLSSFWGHLRHFLASAIATEDVDSRDWMTPDAPDDLLARIAERLGATDEAKCLTECLGRDVWIDFVADTGDDVEVSERVARLVAARYELPDPDRDGEFLEAPRGDILLFGGDTAYPVATVEEINNRVMVPFNRVFQSVDDGVERVLLGIPGNHDWYDGLDGFARLFRHRPDEAHARPSIVSMEQHTMERAADWAREFVRGGHREKAKTLNLIGYTPAQSASYFLLPITERIHLFAIDRQLKSLDFRQRRFFSSWHAQHPSVAPWVVMPDPPYKFGVESPSGVGMIRGINLELERDRALIMTGDIHHYERWSAGNTDYVIAGGGGAFLHPARVDRSAAPQRDVEWPGPEQCRALLRAVPWKIARGRSGFLPHLAFAVLFTPTLVYGVTHISLGEQLLASISTFLLTSFVYSLIGGIRRGRRVLVGCLGLLAGASTAAIPLVTAWGITRLSAVIELPLGGLGLAIAVLVPACFVGAFVFGAYLTLLTRLGLERTQAFTALDHPGYKHFVRLRVRREGEALDGWCIGHTDPLGDGAEPELVDVFTFRVEREPSRSAAG